MLEKILIVAIVIFVFCVGVGAVAAVLAVCRRGGVCRVGQAPRASWMKAGTIFSTDSDGAKDPFRSDSTPGILSVE